MARKHEKLKRNKTKKATESFINGEDDEEALAAAHHDQRPGLFEIRSTNTLKSEFIRFRHGKSYCECD